MDHEQRQKEQAELQAEKLQAEKLQAEIRAMQAKQPYGGMAAYALDEPKRASLRERVVMDLHRSQREASKRDRLAELDMLLNKHPDIARILDLMEEVRG